MMFFIGAGDMFHLFKQTRTYVGEPYCGHTSDGKPAEYKTLREADDARKIFQEKNPVGWDIFEAKSGKRVFGYDPISGELVYRYNHEKEYLERHLDRT